MWLVVVIGLAMVAFFVASSGLIPPVNATTVVRIRGGRLLVQKGRVGGQAKELLTDVLREAGVSNGFMAILPDKRITFSRQIPAAIQQRLRNVLLNLK